MGAAASGERTAAKGKRGREMEVDPVSGPCPQAGSYLPRPTCIFETEPTTPTPKGCGRVTCRMTGRLASGRAGGGRHPIPTSKRPRALETPTALGLTREQGQKAKVVIRAGAGGQRPCGESTSAAPAVGTSRGPEHHRSPGRTRGTGGPELRVSASHSRGPGSESSSRWQWNAVPQSSPSSHPVPQQGT